MSELFRLIQWHLDRYGVKEAAFAKKIGVGKNTVNNWKQRGNTLPKPATLKAITEQVGVPYIAVLDAALVDAGYRDSVTDDLEGLKVRIARYVSENERGVGELQEYLSQPYFPSDQEMQKLHPGMAASDIDGFIDQLVATTAAARYGNDELFDREFLQQYLLDKVSDLEGEEASDGMEGEAQSSASTETVKVEEVAGLPNKREPGTGWGGLSHPRSDRDQQGEKSS